MESLSNDDGNVNESVTSFIIHVQSARGNATTLPLSRHHLQKQHVKSSILEFCKERERWRTNHFNLHAALKTRLLIFHIRTLLGKTKRKRLSYTHKKRENGKLKILQPFSLTFPSCLN